MSEHTAGGSVRPDLSRGSRAVAAGILLSRVAGLVREKVLAYHLGAGIGAEAFRAALRIPNLLQNLLGDGVLSAAFVPTYARAVDEGREQDAGRLAGAVASMLVLVTGALVAIGILLAVPLTRLLTPGFPPGSAKFDLTVTLVRILTPSLGFLVLSAWCLGILSARRHFFHAYVAPVLWNAAIIAAASIAAVLGGTEIGIARAIGWGALAGALLQFSIQLPRVLRLSTGLRPSLSSAVPGLRRVLRSSVGVIAGRGVVQLSAYVDLAVASLLAAGAVAALGYAQVLYLLPVSLFGMSVAAAALPDLATTGRRDPAAAAAEFAAGANRVALFVVPTTVVYVLLPDHVVGALYRGGAFGAPETRQVAAVLAAYALGLIATTQSRLLQTVLYSLDDTVTPARVALLRVGVGTALGVAAMLVLDGWRLDPEGLVRVADAGFAEAGARASERSLLRLGAVGLALGASVGAWVEWTVLRRAVRRRTRLRTDRRTLGRIGLAALAMVPVAVIGRVLVARRLPGLTGLVPGAEALVPALLAVVPAIVTFLAVGAALGLDVLPRRLRGAPTAQASRNSTS
jgi:putative peptidoglycan lipid II flippase